MCDQVEDVVDYSDGDLVSEPSTRIATSPAAPTKPVVSSILAPTPTPAVLMTTPTPTASSTRPPPDDSRFRKKLMDRLQQLIADRDEALKKIEKQKQQLEESEQKHLHAAHARNTALQQESQSQATVGQLQTALAQEQARSAELKIKSSQLLAQNNQLLAQSSQLLAQNKQLTAYIADRRRGSYDLPY